MAISTALADNLLAEVKTDNPTMEIAACSADPGRTNTSATAALISGATRADVSWGTPSGGEMTNSAVAVMNIPGATPANSVTYFAVYNKTSGDFLGGGALGSGIDFTADGTLTAAAGALTWRM